MRERFILTFLFHLVALSLILLPKTIKGSVILVISSVPIRVLDLISFILIVCGSIFLYYSLFKALARQQRIQNATKNDRQDKDIKS